MLLRLKTSTPKTRRTGMNRLVLSLVLLITTAVPAWAESAGTITIQKVQWKNVPDTATSASILCRALTVPATPAAFHDHWNVVAEGSTPLDGAFASPDNYKSFETDGPVVIKMTPTKDSRGKARSWACQLFFDSDKAGSADYKGSGKFFVKGTYP
jgi:hypothetical protein